MDALWKLPPTDLQPTAAGGWQVKSEEGLGSARAVFAPLRRAEPGWEVVLADDETVPLKEVNDRQWTEVPVPPLHDARHLLCLLRYDHPADHPGNTFFHANLPDLSPQDPPVAVSGIQLRQAVSNLAANPALRLELHVVPAPSGAGAAARAATGVEQRADSPASRRDLCFAFGSCQYPAGMLDRRLAYRSYGALADYLQRQGGPEPQRLLLLGDQVYTDATYGLLDPVRSDDRYRIPYEEFNDRESGPFAELPQTFLARRKMTPDDHEIGDNWEPTGRLEALERLQDGMQGYWNYQRRSPQQKQVEMEDGGPGWRLFMADTRTKRQLRTEASIGDALILGEPQTRNLEEWLARPPAEELKIVTTAAMLLPRSRMNMDVPLYLDSWQGYPASFQRLLAFLCDAKVRNVVFLSGDAHLACDARADIRVEGSKESVSFVSLHAPPLYAPYPFANEDTANLLRNDPIHFTVGATRYVCTVTARFFAKRPQGCGLLRANWKQDRWDVEFDVLAPREPPNATDRRYEILTPCSAAM